jgi:hypothetical protein
MMIRCVRIIRIRVLTPISIIFSLFLLSSEEFLNVIIQIRENIHENKHSNKNVNELNIGFSKYYLRNKHPILTTDGIHTETYIDSSL